MTHEATPGVKLGLKGWVLRTTIRAVVALEEESKNTGGWPSTWTKIRATFWAAVSRGFFGITDEEFLGKVA